MTKRNLQFLDDVFAQYEKDRGLQLASAPVASTCGNEACQHLFGRVEHGRVGCMLCGAQEVARELVYSAGGSFSEGADHLQVRRSDDRTIISDLLKMNLSYDVCQLANRNFVGVTRGKTFRCKSRRALMCCSVFLAQKHLNGVADHQALQDLFDVDGRQIMHAMKVLCFSPRVDRQHEPFCDNAFAVSTEDITSRTMQLFGASEAHVIEALEILQAIKGKSTMLSRSRPQSLAASVVFFWIIVNQQPIRMELFKRHTQISPTTIARYCAEISSVTGNGTGVRWGSLHRHIVTK